jgi:hypothetical protein
MGPSPLSRQSHLTPANWLKISRSRSTFPQNMYTSLWTGTMLLTAGRLENCPHRRPSERTALLHPGSRSLSPQAKRPGREHHSVLARIERASGHRRISLSSCTDLVSDDAPGQTNDVVCTGIEDGRPRRATCAGAGVQASAKILSERTRHAGHVPDDQRGPLVGQALAPPPTCTQSTTPASASGPASPESHDRALVSAHHSAPGCTPHAVREST